MIRLQEQLVREQRIRTLETVLKELTAQERWWSGRTRR